MLENFFATRQKFYDLNKNIKLIWYTSFVTGNVQKSFFGQRLQGKRISLTFRPLLGFIRYGLFEIPCTQRKNTEKYDVLFSTIFMRRGDALQDSFFSTLPEILKSENMRVALCGKVAHNFSRKVEDLPLTSSSIPYFCPTHILTKIDMMLCLWRALLELCQLSYPEKDKSILKQEMIQSYLSEVLIGLMIEKMLTKIIEKNPSIVIIHGFEGNTWETACSYACPNTFGFQHGIVMSDQYKLTAFPSRPASKYLISSGPKASAVLAKITNRDRASILDGWTFRHESIYVRTPKNQAPKAIKSVLVLMQGNEHQNGVMNLLKEVVKINPAFQIVLRPHPAVSFEVMGIREGDGFARSTHSNIHDDILAHDVCLYVGSTAALESVYLGVPVVHIAVKDGGVDPLVECGQDMLHKSANSADSLVRAVEEFAEFQEFDQHLQLARNYFEGYFRKPDATMKDSLLKWISR